MAIGSCIIDSNRNIIELQRGALWQGWGFKDSFAFENEEDMPCYVPELVDTYYTKNDILRLCDGSVNIARKIFYQLNWQLPESLLDEELQDGELTICRYCGRLYESYWTDECPYCSTIQEAK